MKKVSYFLLLIFLIFNSKVKSQINNIDFESGTFNHWQGSYSLSSSLNCGTSTPNPLVIGGFDTATVQQPAQQIVSIGFDPLVKTVNLPVNSPFGGNYSVRLGDTLNGCGASMLAHTINTSPVVSDLSICYSVVLYDSGYSFNNAPKFIFQVLTAYNSACILCDTFTVADAVTDTSFHLANTNKPGLYYTSWRKVCVDLLPYIGMTTVVNFISSDCNNHTHLGYAYVDCVLNTCSNVTTAINTKNIASNNVVLYPNPANNYFNLTIENLVNDAFEITLYDIKGAVLMRDNFESSLEKINKTYKTDNLSKGIYFISIKTKQQGTIQKKIIIN